MVNFRDVSFAISDMSDVSEIIPFMVWALFAKKGLPYSILGLFFFLSGFVKICTLVTADMAINNMPAFHFLAFFEITMVYSFYSQLVYQKVNSLVIIGIFFLYAANSFYLQPISTFNSLAWTANMFLIILFGMMFFFRIYKREEDAIPLEKRPDFVITTGWLIYAAGSLFSYLMVTDLITGKPEGIFNGGWIFQNVSNISKNTVISYGFWLTREK